MNARSGVSTNLTNGESRWLDDREFGAFETPLIICGAFVIMEIVYFSPVFNGWIFLVREHTTRKIPDGCREVAIDELPYYEQQLRARA